MLQSSSHFSTPHTHCRLTTGMKLLVAATVLLLCSTAAGEIRRGFKASPPSTFAFHPLLFDSSTTFALGFLPSPPALLHLAVVHVPSATPLWRSAPASWDTSTTLLFNGSLLLADQHTTLHLTPPLPLGDLLRLLPTSNLQILQATGAVLWQSFDHPSDTIVQGQNLTSNTTLFSSDRRFFMRLGKNFIGLYINSAAAAAGESIYFKESAWEIRARIDPGKGPIYARVNSSGYLGVYQVEGYLVHLVPFSTYDRNITGVFWRVTMESDGNLRGYYWNSSNWVAGYQAISNFCDLPASCGAYGLCSRVDTAGQCQCLDNQTIYTAGEDCGAVEEQSPLCGGSGHRVVRRTGVTLPYKELLGFSETSSPEECFRRCEWNCSCWGAIYSNSTKACYLMDFPVGTVVEDAGEGRVGYFKVRRRRAEEESRGRPARGLWVVVGALIAMVVATAAFAVLWRRWATEKRVEGTMKEGLAPVPYRGLMYSPSSPASSSVELSSYSKR